MTVPDCKSNFALLTKNVKTLICADLQVYEVLLNRVPKEADVVKWQTGVPLATASSTGKEKRLHPTMPCKVHYRVCCCMWI